MKVIFLDFDGVIDNVESGWCIIKEKVDLVENIIRATDSKIVVTSSWRLGSRNIEEFIDNHFSEDAKYRCFIKYDVIKDNSLFINSMIDITDTNSGVRGEQIDRWLSMHDNIDNYIIIDDDSDMLDDQLLHFIQTDGYEGITDREVKLAVAVLNKNSYYDDTRLNHKLKYYWQLKCTGLDNNKYDRIINNK